MSVYHRTDAANEILRDGFKDGTGTYLTRQEFTGVWVSNVPLDINEGADGDYLLEVRIPARVFDKYEWVEAGKGYRESLIPAVILNKYGLPAIVSEFTRAERDTPQRRGALN